MNQEQVVKLIEKFKQPNEIDIINNKRSLGHPFIWGILLGLYITYDAFTSKTYFGSQIYYHDFGYTFLLMIGSIVFLSIALFIGFDFLYKSLNWQQPQEPKTLIKFDNNYKEDIETIIENIHKLNLDTIFKIISIMPVKTKLVGISDTLYNQKFLEGMKDSRLIKEDQDFFYDLNETKELIEELKVCLIENHIKDLINSLNNKDTDFINVISAYTSFDNLIKNPNLTEVIVAMPNKEKILNYLIELDLTQNDLLKIREILSSGNSKETFDNNFFLDLFSHVLEKENQLIVNTNDSTMATFNLLLNNYNKSLADFDKLKLVVDENFKFSINHKILSDFIINNNHVNIDTIISINNKIQKLDLQNGINQSFYGPILEEYIEKTNDINEVENFIEKSNILLENNFDLELLNGVLSLFLEKKNIEIPNDQIFNWLKTKPHSLLLEKIWCEEKYDRIDRISLINNYYNQELFDGLLVDVYHNLQVTKETIYQTMKSDVATFYNPFLKSYILTNKFLLELDIKKELDSLINNEWNNLFALKEMSENKDILTLISSQLGGDMIRNIKSNISNLEAQEFMKKKAEEAAEAAKQQAEYSRIQAEEARAARMYNEQALATAQNAERTAQRASREANRKQSSFGNDINSAFSLK